MYDPTGACHCQLMDWVLPGSVDMTKVKFDAQDEDDYKHNYSLLHEAFSKSGITRVCCCFFTSLLHFYWKMKEVAAEGRCRCFCMPMYTNLYVSCTCYYNTI